MNEKFVARIATELKEIEASGLLKRERIISSEQGAEIIVNGKTVLNFAPIITWACPPTPK